MNKKILFILHMPPPIHGSSVVGKNIRDSSLINKTFSCQYINLTTSSNVKEIGKLKIKKIFVYIALLYKVICKLIIWNPDLCYIAITAKGPAFYKDILLVTLVKLFGIKILYHFHNKGVSTKQDKLSYNLLYRFVFHNADVILLSKHLYSDVQKYIFQENVFFCANGIPIIHTKNEVHHQNQICQLLFLSNMMQEKGVYELLQACSLIKQRGFNFACHFVGNWLDIKEDNFVAAVKELDLTDHVYSYGGQYGGDKDKFFLLADIFILPTYYDNESFPLSLLEAMQYGIPVISTNEGGIPDIIDEGRTGYLVNKKDPKDLADKIVLLINNPSLRHQMGLAGKAKFKSNFTISIWENNLLNILTHATNK